jgi:heavy metal sensor kinase
MKIFNSIKWRLQIWYGLILVLVLAGFGFTAYQLERNRLFRQVDDELHQRIGVLANALRRPPPREQDENGQPFDRPPPDQLSEEDPLLQRNRPLPEFNLPSWDTHFFDTNDLHNYYYVIFPQRGGKEIARSANYPNHEAASYSVDSLVSVNTFSQFPAPAPKPPQMFTFDNYRETADVLPSGETIWVGCSIAPELKGLDRAALNLTAIGSLILLVGLAGGWWFVSRALRPVENISAAAVKISAGDLSQRINVAEAESELGKLAAVLNSTFARLESAFAQQKQFASDAAHELRTPVAVILTQTQTALNRERDAASYKETVEACQRAAQRMRKLIKALLELARLDAGQEKLKRLQFDFSKTVEDCVELIRPLADGRNVKISSELEPLEISGDSERLAQVVTNLLTNAIQYNRDGGEVCVRLKIKNGFAGLKISDTGAGIPAEDLPHVFKRFYRGDKSRTGSANAGLGLAISKAIVEAHGGTIEVASKEGVGTTFRVKLPLP